jgi:hypothetical protein
MWDAEAAFTTICCGCPTAAPQRLKVRSIIGLLPLCATTVIERWRLGGRCVKCGAENPPDNTFCGDCGASLSGRMSASPARSPATAITPATNRIAPETAEILEAERKTARCRGASARPVLEPSLLRRIDNLRDLVARPWRVGDAI